MICPMHRLGDTTRLDNFLASIERPTPTKASPCISGLDPNEVILGNPMAKGAIARLGTEGREDGVVGVPRAGVGVTDGEALEGCVVEGADERDGEDGRVVHEVATVDEVWEHGVMA